MCKLYKVDFLAPTSHYSPAQDTYTCTMGHRQDTDDIGADYRHTNDGNNIFSKTHITTMSEVATGNPGDVPPHLDKVDTLAKPMDCSPRKIRNLFTERRRKRSRSAMESKKQRHLKNLSKRLYTWLVILVKSVDRTFNNVTSKEADEIVYQFFKQMCEPAAICPAVYRVDHEVRRKVVSYVNSISATTFTSKNITTLTNLIRAIDCATVFWELHDKETDDDPRAEISKIVLPFLEDMRYYTVHALEMMFHDVTNDISSSQQSVDADMLAHAPAVLYQCAQRGVLTQPLVLARFKSHWSQEYRLYIAPLKDDLKNAVAKLLEKANTKATCE